MTRLSVLISLTLLLPACATVGPSFGGGALARNGRGETGMGMAFRIPSKALERRSNADGNSIEDVGPAGGITPGAFLRMGLSHNTDLGLIAFGTSVRLVARHEWVLPETMSTRPSLRISGGAFGGTLANNDRNRVGFRTGLEGSFEYAVDMGSVYEIWVGPRFSGEWQRGDTFAGTGSIGNFKIGGTLGFAMGLRRVHFIIELTMMSETWFTPAERFTGLEIQPAFGFRFRI